MPRQARKESGTGIYHVMLRGINRQDIFEDATQLVDAEPVAPAGGGAAVLEGVLWVCATKMA